MPTNQTQSKGNKKENNGHSGGRWTANRKERVIWEKHVTKENVILTRVSGEILSIVDIRAINQSNTFGSTNKDQALIWRVFVRIIPLGKSKYWMTWENKSLPIWPDFCQVSRSQNQRYRFLVKNWYWHMWYFLKTVLLKFDLLEKLILRSSTY